MLRGIDVSHHQGSINWTSLKASYGLTWGACKATEGKTFKDDQFPANWRAMKAAGLVRMAYHFAHPDNDARISANAFLDYVDNAGMTSDDIMVMDMEGNSNNLSMLAVRDWLAQWADIVTRETGRKPFLYVGSGYITNNATLDLTAHYSAWWFPRYPAAYDGKTIWPTAINTQYPIPNNWNGSPDIWQFSQSFANKYDANIANMTLADLKTRGLVDEMTLDAEDLAAIRKISYEENDHYGKNFWVAASGTGTALRAQFNRIEAALDPAKLATAIAAKLPSATDLTVAQIEAALREVFADAATPDSPPVA